jgi:hypothetical protein
MILLREEVAEDEEVISAEEIAESEAAGQDYQAGRGEYPPKNSNGSYWEQKIG